MDPCEATRPATAAKIQADRQPVSGSGQKAVESRVEHGVSCALSWCRGGLRLGVQGFASGALVPSLPEFLLERAPPVPVPSGVRKKHAQKER
jgi:hypothetical protein